MHHTSLYIFGQKSESLSKSPLHHFLRSIALTATISSATPRVFLPSQSSPIPSVDLNHEECAVAFSYMCSTHKIYTSCQQARHPSSHNSRGVDWLLRHSKLMTLYTVSYEIKYIAAGLSCVRSKIQQLCLIRYALDLGDTC
jgi:hypothetical protein